MPEFNDRRSPSVNVKKLPRYSFAQCNSCNWCGPIRKGKLEEKAYADQEAHLKKGC